MTPNILLMTSHDLGKHLHCYGQRTVQSPALDALAAQGVMFDRSFCTAPQCSPSRAALHSGRHAHAVGVMGLAHEPFDWSLSPSDHVLAALKAAGYHTTLFGVQHVTRHARDLGYDAVFPVAPARRISAAVKPYLARVKQPFYLEIGFFEPHRPYDWKDVQPDDSLGVDLPPYVPDNPAAREDFAGLQGAIRALDQGVGAVLDALEQSGLAEDTWVIFVPDHGLAMPRAKCTLYDPGLETALIMHWPAGFAGGRRFDHLVSHVDLVPTLLEGLDLPLPDDLHGRSYWPLLQGEPYTPREQVFAEKTFHTAYEPMRAIRTQTHKLIVNFEVGPCVDVPDDIRRGPLYPTVIDQVAGHRAHVELYDLAVDPGETVNLTGQPDVAAAERDLKRRLLAWMRETGDPLLAGPVPSPFYHASLRQLLDE